LAEGVTLGHWVCRRRCSHYLGPRSRAWRRIIRRPAVTTDHETTFVSVRQCFAIVSPTTGGADESPAMDALRDAEDVQRRSRRRQRRPCAWSFVQGALWFALLITASTRVRRVLERLGEWKLVETLRLDYLAVLKGLDHGGRVGAAWDETMTIEWLGVLRLPPYERMYAVQPRGLSKHLRVSCRSVQGRYFSSVAWRTGNSTGLRRKVTFE
jgi:hypothetical protein